MPFWWTFECTTEPDTCPSIHLNPRKTNKHISLLDHNFSLASVETSNQPKNTNQRSQTTHEETKTEICEAWHDAYVHRSEKREREIYWWFTQDLQENYKGSLKISLNKMIPKNGFKSFIYRKKKKLANNIRSVSERCPDPYVGRPVGRPFQVRPTALSTA